MLLAAFPAGASPEFLQRESFGFELSPLVWNAFRTPVDYPPPTVSYRPALAVRLHRLRVEHGYWTPAHLGFAWGMGGESGLLLQLGTEFGWVHRGSGTLELGLGLGFGLFQVETPSPFCDDPCTLGGDGLLVSPVVRYLFHDQHDRLSLGLYARAIVPASQNTFAQHRTGRATGLLVGLDVGLGYFAPPVAAAVALPAREWAGFELAPLAFNEGDGWGDSQHVAPPRYSLGAGIDVRLLRYRFRFGYWTPLALGLYWARLGAATNMVQARTEAGVLWQRQGAALELGLGLGWGGLGVVYARDRCDADCIIGGRGFTTSPVLRVSVARTATRSLGGFLRLVIPSNEQNFLGRTYGSATLFLVGLDLGFGRG